MAYSLFPRFPGQSEFSSLYRLVDELATVSRHPAFTQTSRVFQPRFSLKENETNYELQGELPGVSQKDISIEFTDSQTLSIRGRTETHREEGTRPGLEAAESRQAIEQAEKPESETSSYHHASVEDESDANTTASVAATTPAETPAQTPAEGSVARSEQQQQQQPQEQSRYWISERSVGEFARAFNFPTRIDQENVRASLQNGILSIVVPKAAPHVPKQINID